MEEIPLDTLTTKEVKCVSSKTKLEEVVRLMGERHFSCLVVTEENAPIGIITERDMVKVLADNLDNRSSPTLCASNFMTSPVITINENASLLDAIAITRVRKIRHLPVINNGGEIAGLVTQSDLVRAYLHIIEAQHAAIERSVAERTQELRDANEQLKALSLEDPLLCIGNRR
ncbi:MAG: CBS domain-containing protein, partial [Nitrospiria bacterium]